MNRKEFLRNGALASGAMLLFTRSSVADEPEVFSKDEIYEFVAAAHRSLEDTQKIIDAKPMLLNCTNQISRGDFETALGGASHMGRRDIADLLVARGARMDIFNLTFLGYTSQVKALIEKHPQLLKSYGPHGFSLLHHAQVGKHEAFADWLQKRGLSERVIKGVFKR